jgi:hypothetical protein
MFVPAILQIAVFRATESAYLPGFTNCSLTRYR